MRKLLALCLLLSGCAMRVPPGPGGFADGSGISVQSDEALFIAEVFDDAQGTITKDFPLQQPIRIDALNGTISFYRLNGHCKGKDIATVGFLSSEGGPLTTWDFQDETNAPLSTVFPGGVNVSSLHFQSYNDLCTPTDFRLAVTFHRVTSKEEEK